MKKNKFLLCGVLVFISNVGFGSENFINADIKPIKMSLKLIDTESRATSNSCSKTSADIANIVSTNGINQYIRITPIFNDQNCQLYEEIVKDQSKYFKGNYQFYKNKSLQNNGMFTFSKIGWFSTNAVIQKQCGNRDTIFFDWDFKYIEEPTEQELIINFEVHSSLDGMQIVVEDFYGLCGFKEIYIIEGNKYE